MENSPFVVLDFSYTRASGHHHALNQLVTRTVDQIGGSHKILSSRYIDKDLASSNVIPTFRASVYNPVQTKSELRNKYRRTIFLTIADLFFSGAQFWGRQATILIHTATAPHLIAAIRFFKFFSFKGRINFFLMFPPGFDVPPPLSSEQENYYLTAYKLANQSRLNIRFWCENLPLTTEYQKIGMTSVRHLCLPVDIPPERPPIISRPTTPYTALFIGDPRQDKGFRILVDALKNLSGETENLKIKLELTSLPNEYESIIKPHIDKGLVDIKIHRFIPVDHYFSEIADADICLLPYDPVEYRIKNSNIISESLACGTPVIIPPAPNSLDTYCQQFTENPAVSMESYTGEALARAIIDSYTRRMELKLVAQETMHFIREQRDPKRFISFMRGEA